MKILLLTLLFTLLNFLNSYNQTQISQSISTGGGNGTNNQANLDWTIGQITVSTLSDNNSILTQGLHQGSIIITNIDYNNSSSFSISVYPNPALERINIVISHNEDLVYEFFDINGKLILNGKLLNLENVINLNEFLIGEYILKIVNKKGHSFKTYKISKL